MASIPGMFRNTISLFGLSKSYGLASLRAGFVVADEIIIREVINRTFQEKDSSPDIVGRALQGAFNTSKEREFVYKEYFTNLRNKYIYKYNLLKELVSGIDSVEDKLKDKVYNSVKEVLGYSCFHLSDNSGKFDSELVSLYLKSTEKRKGIGTNLLKETAKEVLSKGKSNMIIWCLSENIEAIKFYEKLGGKKVIEKDAKIGDEIYKEYGFYFDLENILK